MSSSLSKKNFAQGPIFTRLFLFAVPLILSGLLQVGYNMADNIVVGKFSGDSNALAAVGSTAIYSGLIINFLLGFSIGAGVIVAQCFGAGDEKRLKKSIHTSMTIALICGVFFALLAFILTRPILTLMATKEELMESAVLYMNIICVGIPANVIYNFGAAVLRSIGDSKSSLYILSLSGLLNVGLNLVFVLLFKMTVDGVAWATVISQYLSGILVIIIMMRQKGAAKLSVKDLGIDKSVFFLILKLGMPAGLSNAIFNVSNMVITSAFNTFSTTTVYARTVVQNVDTIVATFITSYKNSTVTFAAQNYGSRNLPRIKKVFFYSLIQMLVLTVLSSQIIILFNRPIASLYIGADNPNLEEILDLASGFFKILLNTYFICGIMNVLEGTLRGMKYSLIPSVISVFTNIIVRLLWVYAVFPHEPFNTANWLMASFPISWAIAVLAFIVVLIIAFKKCKKLFEEKKQTL